MQFLAFVLRTIIFAFGLVCVLIMAAFFLVVGGLVFLISGRRPRFQVYRPGQTYRPTDAFRPTMKDVTPTGDQKSIS